MNDNGAYIYKIKETENNGNLKKDGLFSTTEEFQKITMDKGKNPLNHHSLLSPENMCIIIIWKTMELTFQKKLFIKNL